MKNLIFIISTSIFFISCKPERIIQRSNEGLFKENLSNTSGLNNTFIVDNSNSKEAKSKMLREIVLNNLPTSSPQLKYPTWQSYNIIYETTIKNLSSLTQQYCSELFLSSYNIPSQPKKNDLIKTVESHISYLITQNYRGYKLLYQTMVWLKKCGEINFVNTAKIKLVAYAKPLNAPEPNKHDNKMVLENENLKKELDRMLTIMKENDTYISKINAL